MTIADKRDQFTPGHPGGANRRRLLHRCRSPILGLVTLLATLHATGVASGQDVEPDKRTVTVGVYVNPPFVVQEQDHYTGMAIELWEILAERLALATRYEAFPNYAALLEATRNGSIDVAVANITITRERAEILSFTQPWYDAGLRIMVPSPRGQGGIYDLIGGLDRSGHLKVYGVLALIILTATLVMTLFDRRFDDGFPKGWRDGLAENFFQVMSIALSGKSTRKNLFGWVGRVWAGIWLACGVAVVAYVTSSVTSVMTTLSLTQQIHSLGDLHDRTVGVVTGSVSEQFVTDFGLKTRSFNQFDTAVEALKAEQIAAIVDDAPVLEYFARTRPDKGVSVVGNRFHPDKYGFALPHESDLTRPLTLELLGLLESGDVEALRVRYFGNIH